MQDIDTNEIRERFWSSNDGRVRNVIHALCDALDEARKLADRAQSRREHYQARYAEQYDRAVKAEATIERVRSLCADEERDAETWAAMRGGDGVGRVAVDVEDVLAALDGSS